ncbi:MAG TPA: M24 family metallopeptidase [Candidatus Polarisedimenticolia bacterium]|nr:M24 family metallopeptidase [Candidatus Polarisedimenticolia bacterium]
MKGGFTINRRRKRPGSIARAIAGVPEHNADLLYACGYSCADPIAWLRVRGRSLLLVGDLEIEGARRTATVDAVVPTSRIAARLSERRIRGADLHRIAGEELRRRGARRVEVPFSFPAGGIAPLRRAGLRVSSAAEPFFPERSRKSAPEIRSIRAALRAAEAGLAAAVMTLAASRIGRDRRLRVGKQVLTSEILREIAERAMFAAGAAPDRSIVAGGIQGADPHHRGSGPLAAHRPIVLDFFPRDRLTGYYGDITRTVVKGRADAPTRKAFLAVHEAQRLAFELIRHGAEGSKIHGRLLEFFRETGYPVRRGGRRREGFFHGTGHGLGLELHEPPTIGSRPARLEAGQVITVEPGLYYPWLGGMRIEDVVLVTRGGCSRLTRFPVFLEIP